MRHDLFTSGARTVKQRGGKRFAAVCSLVVKSGGCVRGPLKTTHVKEDAGGRFQVWEHRGSMRYSAVRGLQHDSTYPSQSYSRHFL